jgi:hypothetical protein
MVTLIQRSFSGGEIAPSLYARVDTLKYATGLRTCRNNIVMRHGGCSSRPGTAFVAETKNTGYGVRLIPFVFNSTQTYVLEFGHQYMRVHRSGVQQTLTAQNITAITNANPCVVTYSGSDTYSAGNEVYVSGITGAIGTFLNGRNFVVGTVDTGANTFTLKYMDGTNVNSTSFGSYTSGGTIAEVYEISTPYSASDLSALNFIQSADVITLVHPTYAPRTLSRTGHTSWTLSTITFAPSMTAPSAGGSISGSAGGLTIEYAITAVSEEDYEESLAYTFSNGSLSAAAVSTPHTVSWTAVTGATEYNVYIKVNGIYGLVGVAGSTSFVNDGITPDLTVTPPEARNPFSGTGDYPSAVAYFQQRLSFGNTTNDSETIWCSRTGYFNNFTVSSPSQADDSLQFSVVGSQVNQIKHLIELNKPIVMTSSGEWVLEGDSSGILRPTDINPKQHSYNGIGDLRPLIIGGNILYVQARGSIVRSLGFDYQVDGYRGDDLTIFAAHMFDGYTITDWAYQQVPHSIIWAVRDDGKLLGLTYVREHQVTGWHIHDFGTGAVVENVCVVPEGTEDVLYVTVTRTIDGVDKTYVERMDQRRVDDIVDYIGMDSTLTYDGRNTAATTMTMTEYSSGGWLYTSTITVTASASTFVSTDVGNEIHITSADGEVIRVEITSYVSATVVRGRPNRTVPAAMRSTAYTTWSRAVDQITGLWHIEGETVSIMGDGFVVGSPNNESYTTYTVSDGSISLEQCFSVIHIGLPFICDIETLDIDQNQGPTMVGKQKAVTEVQAFVEKSRGMFVGSEPPTDDTVDPLEGLTELKVREEEGYDATVGLSTGTVSIVIRQEWNSNGRVFVRQVDPLPLSVLSIAPSGYIPVGG